MFLFMDPRSFGLGEVFLDVKLWSFSWNSGCSLPEKDNPCLCNDVTDPLKTSCDRQDSPSFLRICSAVIRVAALESRRKKSHIPAFAFFCS